MDPAIESIVQNGELSHRQGPTFPGPGPTPAAVRELVDVSPPQVVRAADRLVERSLELGVADRVACRGGDPRGPSLCCAI